MMPQRLLFLLGGSAAYDVFADEFVAAAGGRDARIAALVQNRAGWEKHEAEITQPWIERGAVECEPVVPDEDGALDLDSATATLRRATAIFIGGGHTPTYHRLFATGPIREVIRARYQEGIPIAGVSAGALISLESCQLTPDETGGDELEIAQGLGLVKDLVLGVHFTEWNALPEVIAVMHKTRTRWGLGLDEPACAVIENDRFARALGTFVHSVEWIDLDEPAYRVTRL